MKAFEVESLDIMTDYRHHSVVVAETREEAESKLGNRHLISSIVPMQDEVTYNVRGTEEVTGITLTQTWVSDEGDEVAKRDAKSYIGSEFKRNNPQLFEKGQRVKFDISLFVANSRVTVEERVAKISREVLVA